MLEYDNPEKHIGPKVIVKKVERIKKDDFKDTDYKIVSSKRFIRKLKKNNTKKANPQKKEMLSNKDKNLINQLLADSLKIDKGEFGKKSIKIIKGDKVLEKGIKLDLQALNICEKIAEYINQNYKQCCTCNNHKMLHGHSYRVFF